jgi:hypothetical protein
LVSSTGTELIAGVNSGREGARGTALIAGVNSGRDEQQELN